MIEFKIGNLLEDTSESIVNTVNCEGYMGKGIAYQFKLKYPENNKDYVRACKSKELRIGTIHSFKEAGKIIINFPTKDKWRKNSEISYIKIGLDLLNDYIIQNNIKSIAIPPLGCGNGGLNWTEIKPLILDKLQTASNSCLITLYEPSASFKALPTTAPKLTTASLVLMQIKINSTKFNALRVQKSAYFLNIFSKQNYFKFKKHKFGPYDNTITIISRDIKAFQDYYGTKVITEAYDIAYKNIISDKSNKKLSELYPYIMTAANFVNNIAADKFLEGVSTVTFLVQTCALEDENRIVQSFKGWSEDKLERFSESEIISYIRLKKKI
jgi:O-acetyl-ADP-ribose deacetylase (regulator of RNase III)